VLELPESLNNAIKSFSRLPGVGEKTATRQIMNIVNWDQDSLLEFSNAIISLAKVKKCSECGLYTDEEICQICSDDERASSSILCVVESISDLLAIERSNEFRGSYHVLGGVLNPLMGLGPDQLKIEKLVERVKKYDVQTLILAVNPSVEGDATCSYINQLLEDVKVERIGFGIPMGGSLEFLDPLTISKALENRKLV
jgi:recombination protein RecR